MNFFIRKINNLYFVGCDEIIEFRNKKTLIQKLNQELYKIYENNGDSIKRDEQIIDSAYSYSVKCEDDYITDNKNRTRNYKKYSILINTTLFETEVDAIIYLEGLLNELIAKLIGEIEDDIELNDEILDIIEEG